MKVTKHTGRYQDLPSKPQFDMRRCLPVTAPVMIGSAQIGEAFISWDKTAEDIQIDAQIPDGLPGQLLWTFSVGFCLPEFPRILSVAIEPE